MTTDYEDTTVDRDWIRAPVFKSMAIESMDADHARSGVDEFKEGGTMIQQQLFDVAETERMLSGMEMEQVMQTLLTVRTRQRVGSKKRAAKRAAERAAKAKPKRVRLSIEAMTKIAKSAASPAPGYANLYDYILSEADLRADALLKDSAGHSVPGGTPS